MIEKKNITQNFFTKIFMHVFISNPNLKCFDRESFVNAFIQPPLSEYITKQ